MMVLAIMPVVPMGVHTSIPLCTALTSPKLGSEYYIQKAEATQNKYRHKIINYHNKVLIALLSTPYHSRPLFLPQEETSS